MEPGARGGDWAAAGGRTGPWPANLLRRNALPARRERLVCAARPHAPASDRFRRTRLARPARQQLLAGLAIYPCLQHTIPSAVQVS